MTEDNYLKEKINDDITTLILNYGLKLDRSQCSQYKIGYEKLVNYIYDIECKKEKLRTFIEELKDCDYINKSIEDEMNKVLAETI